MWAKILFGGPEQRSKSAAALFRVIVIRTVPSLC
jgi:hypothetical protein